MTLHFLGLNLSCHPSCRACSCMRSCCSSWQSRTDFTDLYITQSSANSRTVDVVCSARSLMKIRKSSGPSTDPCGMPDFTDAGPDVVEFFLQEMTVSIRTGYHSFPTSRGVACGQQCQSFGKIQNKHVHLADVIHHFRKIMGWQYQLSLAGVSFAKAMLHIYQYPMFIKMVQNVPIDDVFQNLI